jgi:hypothetical protein
MPVASTEAVGTGGARWRHRVQRKSIAVLADLSRSTTQRQPLGLPLRIEVLMHECPGTRAAARHE